MTRVYKGRPGRRPATSVAEGEPVGGLRYIETSALLAAVLESDPAAAAAVNEGLRVASALTFAEAARAVMRGRATGRLAADKERAALGWLQAFRHSCNVFAITEVVLVRVGRPFPVEPVRTLDAIHLATLELLGEPPQLITVVTRDLRVAANAKAMGYRVE